MNKIYTVTGLVERLQKIQQSDPLALIQIKYPTGESYWKGYNTETIMELEYIQNENNNNTVVLS